MSYIELKGNLFNTKAMAIVNTVNCVGAMGKGVALDFKLRYPKMFKEYQKICFRKLLNPGQILPYRESSPIILNFAIKDDWKDPSRIEWVEETLRKFSENYKSLGITSIAFPWMGAMNGGLPIEEIKTIMRKYLSNLNDIDVEVYEFDPDVPCKLFNALEHIISTKEYSLSELSEMSNIQSRYWVKIEEAMKSSNVRSINNLCSFSVEGKKIIGKTNIERLFLFLTNYNEGKLSQPNTLFR